RRFGRTRFAQARHTDSGYENHLLPLSALTAVLIVMSIILAAAPLCGQTVKGTILGTITDTSHGVIQGVQVVLTETNTNSQRTELTNDSGFFAFANLDPGEYRIEVEHPGFRKVVRSEIALDANSTVRADLQLTPGQVTETVDVTAETPVLKTDRA